MPEYRVRLEYNEFREYLVETDDGGPWGDKYFHDTFDKYVEDDIIEIEYKYGPCRDGKTMIKWKIPDDKDQTVRVVRYGGSSIFAMWWCSATDDIEEEDD